MSRTVLVCDDEPHITRAITLKLDRAGFEVHTASDGVTAWELAQRLQPDLIITDNQMPGQSGLDLIHLVRGHQELHATPCILLTAKAFELHAEQELLQSLQLAALVSKPFSPRELLATACQALALEPAMLAT